MARTWYKPAWRAVMVATLATKPFGPDHAKTAPAVVDVAVTDAEGAEQTNCPVPTLTVGAVKFEATEVDASAEQPLAGSVTVTE